MKKTIMSISIALLLAAAPQGYAADDTSALLRSTVRTIQVNADDTQRDAKIYQWKRVSLQVARIASSEKKAHELLAKQENQSKIASRLHESVEKLRAAHTARNADRTVQAAKSVSSVCQDISAKP